MIILEWAKPGIWIEGLDSDTAWRIDGQIGCLEKALLEANVALNMFNQAATSRPTMERDDAEFETRMKISQEVEAELFPNGRFQAPTDDFAKRQVILDTEIRHRMWQLGFLPRSYQSIPRFIFAKAFIHALDLFDKFLADIAKDPGAPKEKIQAIHKSFSSALPDLREVRNSIQHAEDRSKGEVRGKEIDLKKIDKPELGIQGTVLINSGLHGNKFGTTKADGHYGVVDVSVETVEVLRTALLDVYSTFEWTGGKSLYPT